jgi:hypothetical protein
MTVEIKRIHFADNFTIGKLFINDIFICFTLEDKVREVDNKPVATWKVPKQTAIPKGEYPLRITFSNRFQKDLPLIENVEGFIGIRIHTGNSPLDTEGCILVGMTWDGSSGWIANSREAFKLLMPLIIEPTLITIS